MKRLFLIAALAGSAGFGQEAPARFSWDASLYADSTIAGLVPDSVLDPGNALLRVAQHDQNVQARGDLRGQTGDWSVFLRPIVTGDHTDNAFGDATSASGYLSQDELRWKPSASWSLGAARAVMTWGPGQFRSPSNPFYFDNGLNDPLLELSGLDAAIATWTPDVHGFITAAWIFHSPAHYRSYVDPLGVGGDLWRDTMLVRGERRWEEWTGGFAVARTASFAPFYGWYLQHVVSDALTVYVEQGSSTLRDALLPSSGPAAQIAAARQSPRHADTLLGAAYTFEGGRNITAEYLHNGHGMSAAEEARYFAQAASGLTASARVAMVAGAPPLLGRNYLYAVWQSPPLRDDGYWRLMFSRNLDDRGNQVSGYAEYPVDRRMSVYALLVFDPGARTQEFSSVLSRSVTAGVRIDLP